MSTADNKPVNQGKLITTGIFFALIFFGVMIFSKATFLTLEQNERGVLFKRFSGGLDKDKVYMPGFHIVAPWNEMHRYSIREEKIDESMSVLSNNGLDIQVDVTVRVAPFAKDIGDLHEKFGEDYSRSLVGPEVRSSVRKVIGNFQPEELYSTKRDEVQSLIQEDLERSLAKNYIELKAALIRDIKLPEKVKNAIETKLEAEQTALKYVYILDQERKEAERKIIEAEAKARANQILNASLSNNILRDKGIEATLKLADSDNAKVIIVGGEGSDGLPLILGGN